MLREGSSAVVTGSASRKGEGELWEPEPESVEAEREFNMVSRFRLFSSTSDNARGGCIP